MWSLPDIKTLNRRAATEKGKVLKAVKTRKIGNKKLSCEHDHGDCNGPIRVYPWYDIFSDDPKGVIALCERHDGYFGSPTEGYFECGRCNKIFIENYTWENYYHHDDCDGQICLNCYARQVIGDATHPAWVKTDGSETIDFDRIRQSPHIIAVEGPTHGLEFLGNIEFDNTSGETISGEVGDLHNLLKDAAAKGYYRALLVLDAAYQFAVSIGLYVNPQDKKD